MLVVAALQVASAVYGPQPAQSSARQGHRRPTFATWRRTEVHVCAHSLLFEHKHAIGTRAGALAVARDIRASTHHRLARVEAGGTPTVDRILIKRWLALEQRLANLYAKTYVQIYDVIASSNTPTQRHQEVSRLETLIHAPDRLRALAAHLDEQLHIPDCTGGGE